MPANARFGCVLTHEKPDQTAFNRIEDFTEMRAYLVGRDNSLAERNFVTVAGILGTMIAFNIPAPGQPGYVSRTD
jgi:hypothetical protein